MGAGKIPEKSAERSADSYASATNWSVNNYQNNSDEPLWKTFNKLQADYDKLKAENYKLKNGSETSKYRAATTALTLERDHLKEENDALRKENDTLSKEIGRLRKILINKTPSAAAVKESNKPKKHDHSKRVLKGDDQFMKKIMSRKSPKTSPSKRVRGRKAKNAR